MRCGERHPDGSFVTLIVVAAAYCSPEAHDGAYADLISRASGFVNLIWPHC